MPDLSESGRTRSTRKLEARTAGPTRGDYLVATRRTHSRQPGVHGGHGRAGRRKHHTSGHSDGSTALAQPDRAVHTQPDSWYKEEVED
eukprot:9480562-Pyramimonas_sp.AAC.1